MGRKPRISHAIVALASALLVAAAPAAANPYGSPGSLSDAGNGGGLGQSVSISGDGTVAVVGEPNAGGGSGAALVYANDNGSWSFVQRLTPSGETGAGHFGAAVSMDSYGQTLVVGAPDDNGGVGKAWAFALSNGTWSEQGHFLGGAGETGAGKFGASVAVASGGYMTIVGAPMSDAGEGQVFTFEYDTGSGWYLFQHMDRAGISGPVHLGASVALDNTGDGGVVGAPNAGGSDGAVYPYTHFGLESPYWIDHSPIPSPVAGGHFGASVSMSRVGDQIVAGAPLAASGAGRAYEYRPNGNQEAEFANPTASANGEFGTSVALAGSTEDELVVGAPGDNGGAGAAYDFDAAHGADWLTDGAAVTPAGASAAGDGYGTSVAVAADGSHALVGAPGAGAGDGLATHFISANITAPDPPMAVQAYLGTETGSADVGWSDGLSTGGSPITGYTATASPGGQTCTSTTATGCTVHGLAGGQSYTFTVTATNGFGTSAPSAPSGSLAIPAAPGTGGFSTSGGSATGGNGGAPTGAGGGPTGGGATTARPQALGTPSGAVKPAKVTRTSITLSWGAASGAPIAGYRILEAHGRGWKVIGTVPASKHSFTLAGLRHKTHHRFEVVAVDAAGRVSPPLVGRWVSTK